MVIFESGVVGIVWVYDFEVVGYEVDVVDGVVVYWGYVDGLVIDVECLGVFGEYLVLVVF